MDKFFFTICVYLVCFVTLTWSVKICSFYVPGRAGNEAPLVCRYDLESDHLYDVKWYKDGEQFFRCEPNGIRTVFPVDGVKVQHVKFAPLGACSLTLMMLTQKTAGEYKCEVNTEGPKFNTASASKFMAILEPIATKHNFTNATKSHKTNNTIINYQQDINEESANHSSLLRVNLIILLIINYLHVSILLFYT